MSSAIPVFKNVKVLELAAVLAGPAVGQFFAELGADVVKVEPPQTGDVTRSWRAPGEDGSVSAYFSCVNWGKRSIALDLKNTIDRELLHRLIAEADIIITSFRPGTEKALALDYSSVQKMNPGIIYGQITGYGRDSQRVGYDAVIQAESGFMYLNGHPELGPQKMPVALIDVLAAHQLKEALLVAWIQHMQTGKGSFISVSLMDAALASLANQSANLLVGKKEPQPSGSLHPNIAPYGEIIITKDGLRIVLAVGNDRQFEALASLSGLNKLLSDPRYASNTARVKNRKELFGILQSVLGEMSGSEFLAFCHEHHIPAGEIRTVGEAIKSSGTISLQADGLEGIRSFIADGLPQNTDLTGPPLLDQHHQQILSDWLGKF